MIAAESRIRGPNGDTALPAHDSNPFLAAARREWLERYGGLVQARDQWRQAALLSWLVTGLAVGGMIYAATQTKLVPYVIQVDRLGTSVAVGRADRAGAPDPRIVRAQLARWIAASRAVYVDAAAQRASIDEAYSMIGRSTPAHAVLTDHYRSADPFTRAEGETVIPRVHTALPMSANTWRVEWTETVRGRNGEMLREEEWQAAITVQTVQPKDEETMLRNPMGIYIPDFSWTKRLTEGNANAH